MELYDSVKISANFVGFAVEQHDNENNFKRHCLRGKWNILLSFEKDGKALRTMILPFSNGPSEIVVLGYAGSYMVQRKNGKNVIAGRDKRWVESRIIDAVLTNQTERTSDVLRQMRTPEPTKFDVLYCIVSDIDGLEETIGFEEWADNFGFDSDSRKAEGIYHACCKEAREFRNFMGGAKNVRNISAFVRMIDEMGEENARNAWNERTAPKKVETFDSRLAAMRAEAAKILPAAAHNAIKVETLETRFAAMRDEADLLLLAAAQNVIKECPRIRSASALLGTLSFTDKNGNYVHPDDDNVSAKEKKVLEEFLRQGEVFQEMFGPSFGPWRISQDGSVDTNW